MVNTMDILKDNKKIGTLHNFKINELEIEGLWIGYFEPIDIQNEPYILKKGNELYENCWLFNSTRTNNGSIVKFQVGRKRQMNDKEE